MSDLEKIELMFHRVAERAPGPIGFWLKECAKQLAEDEWERGNRPEPKVQI